MRRDGRGLELSVVVPTFRERENVQLLIAALDKVLHNIEWEVIVVDDDSPDNTASLVRGLAAVHARVRILQRLGRRGLSSACIEGILASPAPYIAVMDADLQHDENILPEMLRRLKEEEVDIVVGTRNSDGGSMGAFARERVQLSFLGARLSKFVCFADLSDPMSGFFIVRREFFEEVVHRLSGAGFKILVDLVASSRRPVRIAEVGYRFRNRMHGKSKLDISVELEYLHLLVDKLLGRAVPTRFVLFVMVGAFGLLVHLGVLAVMFLGLHGHFLRAQAVATIAAMTVNFLLNNLFTFRDYRLSGWQLLSGLLKFYLACSVGALANLGFAGALIRRGVSWYFAGVGGVAVGSVWNYAVNAAFTWRRRRPAYEFSDNRS